MALTKWSACFALITVLAAGQSLPAQTDPVARRDIGAINERLNNNKTGLQAISDKLGGHETRLAGAEKELGDAKEGLNATRSKVDDPNTGLARLSKRINEVALPTQYFLHRFWVLLAAVLVFFMQAGFKCLEVGMARQRFDAAVGVMNLMNWLVLCLVFFAVGFGLMFGPSAHGSGLVGWGHFAPAAKETLTTVCIEDSTGVIDKLCDETKSKDRKEGGICLPCEIAA